MLKSLQNLSQRFVDLCNTIVPNSDKMPTQTRSFSDITTAFSLAGSGAVENVTETVNKGRIYLKAKRNPSVDAKPTASASASATPVRMDESADLDLSPAGKKPRTEATPAAATPVVFSPAVSEAPAEIQPEAPAAAASNSEKGPTVVVNTVYLRANPPKRKR